MKHLKFASLVAMSLAIGAGAAMAQDKPDMSHADAVEKYARDFAASWVNDAKLVEAIKAATAEHKKLTYDELTLIDNQWRYAKSEGEDKKAAGKLEGLSSDSLEDQKKKGQALIDTVRGSDASKFLIAQMEKAEPKGAVTEIFVMDGWGWNVGQTGGTSDYYQGDEGKWQKTFASDGVEISPVEEEDGVKFSQVSFPIKEGGKNIGAVTVGVDVTKVK